MSKQKTTKQLKKEFNKVKKQIKKAQDKQEVQIIKSAILKSDLTLDLIKQIIENAKIVRPDFLFELHVVDKAANGGVIGSKLFTSTFGELSEIDPGKLYSELTDDFSDRFTETPTVIDARSNL